MPAYRLEIGILTKHIKQITKYEYCNTIECYWWWPRVDNSAVVGNSAVAGGTDDR